MWTFASRRVLKKDGVLVTCHFSYLPRKDEVARETETLILKYNPEWTAADMAHEIPAHPEWAKDALNVRAMFYYDEAIAFTRESWSAWFLQRFWCCTGSTPIYWSLGGCNDTMPWRTHDRMQELPRR